MTAFAFQCQDCGHLEVPEFAGDRAVPINCRHCDFGSHLEWKDADGFPAEPGAEGATPRQVIDRPNPFTVLADLTEAEQLDLLARRADAGDTIVRHTPA